MAVGAVKYFQFFYIIEYSILRGPVITVSYTFTKWYGTKIKVWSSFCHNQLADDFLKEETLNGMPRLELN